MDGIDHGLAKGWKQPPVIDPWGKALVKSALFLDVLADSALSDTLPQIIFRSEIVGQ
jgi:hypothetical protein